MQFGISTTTKFCWNVFLNIKKILYFYNQMLNICGTLVILFWRRNTKPLHLFVNKSKIIVSDCVWSNSVSLRYQILILFPLFQTMERCLLKTCTNANLRYFHLYSGISIFVTYFVFAYIFTIQINWLNVKTKLIFNVIAINKKFLRYIGSN